MSIRNSSLIRWVPLLSSLLQMRTLRYIFVHGHSWYETALKCEPLRLDDQKSSLPKSRTEVRGTVKSMRPQCCNLSLLVPSSYTVAVVAEVLMILYRWLQSVLVLVQLTPTLMILATQYGEWQCLGTQPTIYLPLCLSVTKGLVPWLLFSNYIEGFPFLVSNGMKYGTVSQAQESPCTNASLETALGVFGKPQVSICLVWSESRGQDSTLEWQPWS